ncbi:hypothetical protein VNO80_15637 [Phaseolus coccineus]|uniref:Uncharacterized protein n=1 Tax=Phaseolus coccineus TaxID=3886 RepID=A0AAN9ML01_PHACN
MRHENYPMSLWISLATKLIKAELRGISEGNSASVAAAEHFVRFCPFRPHRYFPVLSAILFLLINDNNAKISDGSFWVREVGRELEKHAEKGGALFTIGYYVVDEGNAILLQIYS